VAGITPAGGKSGNWAAKWHENAVPQPCLSVFLSKMAGFARGFWQNPAEISLSAEPAQTRKPCLRSAANASEAPRSPAKRRERQRSEMNASEAG
jgi:putative heme iron utilization protein